MKNTDDTNDSDGDGMPDSVELVIGTDPLNPDTDFDGLGDYEEALMGMDPNSADSNDDRFPDYLEVTNVSLDTDGDGLPNAWDPDNDNDGVPDYLDLSPFALTPVESSFQIDVHTSGNPTYVSFQLRTSNPNHMRLIQQSWDWPNDTRGSFRDLDGSVNDIVIIPSLKIDSQNLPAQGDVSQYGIIEDNSSAYVPLFPVWDYGNIVAFKGRMFFPETTVQLNVSINASLIWRVSGMNDNQIVAFSTLSGDYFSLQPEGSVRAVGNAVGTNETFMLMPLGGDKAALRAANGMYLEVNPNGSVSASAQNVTSETGFTFKDSGSGYVTIVASNGHNLTASPDGTLTATGLETVGTSRFAKTDLGVVSSPTVLATYYEDFALTGLNVDENFGTKIGVLKGTDSDELVAANLLLAYQFLRNSSYGLDDVPTILADHKLSSISADIEGFSHQDEALQASTASMIPDAVKSIPSGATLPIIVAMEDSSAGVDLSEISSSYIVDGPLSIDLTNEAVVVSKMLRSSWYVGGSTTPLELYQVINNVRTWGLNDSSLETAVGLISAWYCGEQIIASVGGVNVQHDCPEVVFVNDVVDDIVKYGTGTIDALLQTVELLDSAYAFSETFARLGSITKTAGQSTWSAFKATFNSVQESLLSETKMFQRISTAMNVVAVVLAVGISLYALFAIGNELGWDAVGTGIAITYAVVTLAYSLVLLGLAVFGGPVGAIIADIIMIIDCLAQILFGFDFLAEFIGWLIDCFTDTRTRSQVTMDYVDSDMSFVDVDQNGIDVGDNITYSSRLYGNVSITSDGSYSDLVDSYIIPHQVLWAPWGSNSVSGGSTVATSTVYTSTSKSVLYNTSAWLRPGIGMVNFPVAVGMYSDYKVYYDDCWWFFGWWCDRESQSNNPANTQVTGWTTIYFDVMPGSIDEFYNWRGIASDDFDGDGLNNSAEIAAGTNPWSWDTDGDGLGDNYELEIGTDPTKADTDSDGLNDRFEHSRGFNPCSADSDGDGLKDFFEYRGWVVNITYRGHEYYWMVNSDPNIADTDGDGLSDFEEYYSLLNPRSGDTNGDGTPDVATNYYLTRIEYDSSFVSIVSDYHPFIVAADEDGFVYSNTQSGGRQIVMFAPNGTEIEGFTVAEAPIDIDCVSAMVDGERETLIFVTSYESTAIYARNGTLLGAIPVGDIDSEANDHLLGIALYPEGPDPGTYCLYAADSNFHIHKLVMDGPQELYEETHWGSQGSGPGQFQFFVGYGGRVPIDVDLQSQVYVWDSGNKLIQKFGPDGTFLLAWGEQGDQDGFLQYVRDIAVDADNNLLTFDKGGDFADRIQKWSPDGRWMFTFEGDASGNTLDVDLQNYIYVAGWENVSRWKNIFEPVTPEYTFVDADSDGLSDSEEVAGWNITVAFESGLSVLSVRSDPLAPDTDFDGLNDSRELALMSNPRSTDTDRDNLTDLEEVELGTNVTNWDTDGDGLGDGAEVMFGSDPTVQDTDGDGLSDLQEFVLGTNPNSNDTDNDGLNDMLEIGYGSDPKNPDTDGDLMFDGQEYALGANPTSVDTDSDGVDDGYETLYGTNVSSGDTDGDHLSDGFEIASLMSPLSNDTDGDGVNDSRELELGLNPLNPDSDGDGIPDSLDQDYKITLDGEIVLAYDDPDACAVFASQLSANATVSVVDASKVQSEHSTARYIVLVGDPNAGPGTAGALIRELLQDSGDVLDKMTSSDYDRMAVRYGLWTDTQTIVMLSHVYDYDSTRVLGVLKSMRMTVSGTSVLVDYLNPRSCFKLDQIDTVRSTDTFVWSKLSNMTTFSVMVEKLNETGIQVGLSGSDALAPGEEPMGKYVRIEYLPNDPNVSALVLGSMVEIYYTVSDLDTNGDGDADDPGDLNESQLQLFVLSGTGEWTRLSDIVSTTGVNTTDTNLFGMSYAGYLWANVSGLSTFGIAGMTNNASLTPDEMYDALREIIMHYYDLGVLNKGRANSLLQKLDASEHQWQDNPGTMAASNILEAFIKETGSMVKPGVLSDDQGALLIMKAQDIIQAIGPS